MAERPNESLILAASPMLYVKLYIQTVECGILIDSRASDNFISANLVRYLRIQVRNLPTTCHIRAVNGGRMPCTHYVVVRATPGELRFSLTLRVIPTDLRVIFGYPFMRFCDSEIWWWDRRMSIIKRDHESGGNMQKHKNA